MRSAVEKPRAGLFPIFRAPSSPSSFFPFQDTSGEPFVNQWRKGSWRSLRDVTAGPYISPSSVCFVVFVFPALGVPRRPSGSPTVLARRPCFLLSKEHVTFLVPPPFRHSAFLSFRSRFAFSLLTSASQRSWHRIRQWSVKPPYPFLKPPFFF